MSIYCKTCKEVQEVDDYKIGFSISEEKINRFKKRHRRHKIIIDK